MRDAPEFWYRNGVAAHVLAPLSGLYCAAAVLRRHAYRRGIQRSTRLPVPVVVVGNLTVGGTGKTPFVIWLIRHLASRGVRAGVLTRGYGGHAREWPQWVATDSDPVLVGDEPVLIAQRTVCPVVAGPDRVAAGRWLLEREPCGVLVCDDGLQHYRLQRNLEIVMLDGRRGLGNGRCLPAGPLREPAARLRDADLVLTLDAALAGAFRIDTALGAPRSLLDAHETSWERLRASPVHAIAGIARPERFFDALRAQGLTVIAHPFPDHHRFTREELVFRDGLPVLMTEKDAVKCTTIAAPEHWVVPLELNPSAAAAAPLDTHLTRILHGQEAA